MARNKRSEPLHWNDISDDAGKVIGQYALRDGWITVRDLSGRSKEARASPSPADSSGLARLVLSEFALPRLP